MDRDHGAADFDSARVALSLPRGTRLGLALSVEDDTGGALQIGYDAPTFDSRIRLATTGSAARPLAVAAAPPPRAKLNGQSSGQAAIFLFPAGLLFGSFLTVVAHRVPRGESVVGGRSHCPACGAQIAAYDNVPVVSWLLLRGRARCCGAPISARYPLTELAPGRSTRRPRSFSGTTPRSWRSASSSSRCCWRSR